MKVFAEFIKENEQEYRRNTILQFGDSWDLIGSVVLVNPGSAYPKGEIEDIDFEKLSRFFSNYHQTNIIRDTWHVFNADPTMGQIEKIFNGSYILDQKDSKQRTLNGIIQLHNLFNMRDANLARALSIAADIKSDFLYSDKIHETFKDKPVYLGWGKSIKKYPILKNIACEIFENTNKNTNPCYNKDIEKNRLYHPGYINRSYKYQQEFLAKFYALIE